MNYKKLSKLSDSLEQKFKLFAGPTTEVLKTWITY